MVDTNHKNIMHKSIDHDCDHILSLRPDYLRVKSRTEIYQSQKNYVFYLILVLQWNYVGLLSVWFFNCQVRKYAVNVSNVSPFPLDLKSLDKNQ